MLVLIAMRDAGRQQREVSLPPLPNALSPTTLPDVAPPPAREPRAERHPEGVPSQATRIVPLSPSVETKLAAAWGLPRVVVIGIKAGAPGTAPLIEYAQSNLQAVDVPWVREASAAVYKPVNVLAEVKGKHYG